MEAEALLDELSRPSGEYLFLVIVCLSPLRMSPGLSGSHTVSSSHPLHSQKHSSTK